MSLRDISFILKKGQANHGIVTMMDDGNNRAIITATITTNHPIKNPPKLTNSLVRERSL